MFVPALSSKEELRDLFDLFPSSLLLEIYKARLVVSITQQLQNGASHLTEKYSSRNKDVVDDEVDGAPWAITIEFHPKLR